MATTRISDLSGSAGSADDKVSEVDLGELFNGVTVDLLDSETVALHTAFASLEVDVLRDLLAAPVVRRTRRSRADSEKIRVFWREQGHEIEDKGRIPNEAVVAYNQANGTA